MFSNNNWRIISLFQSKKWLILAGIFVEKCLKWHKVYFKTLPFSYFTSKLEVRNLKFEVRNSKFELWVSRLHLNSNSRQSDYLTLIWVIWPVFVSILCQSFWQRVTIHRANMFYFRENNFISSILRCDHWPFDFRRIKYYFRVEHVRKCLVAVWGVKHKT